MTQTKPVVHLILFNAFSGGGVNRVVLKLGSALADSGHRVTVTSVRRLIDNPRFEFDPRFEVIVLDDVRREGRGGWRSRLRARPSRLADGDPTAQVSLLTDLLLIRHFRRLKGGVIITTRPVLHLAAARWAPKSAVTIAQEHVQLLHRKRNLRKLHMIAKALPRLDAFVTLTEGDAEDYRVEFPEQADRIRSIRNSLSWEPAEQPTSPDPRVIVAMGRLEQQKNFPRLLRAFRQVADRHPDWRLDIYGRGSEEEHLRHLIDELGLEGQARLCGYSHDARATLRTGSIYALSSNFEGLPLVLIEAMSVGLSVATVDGPRGPSEIIRDRENGKITPMHPSALAAALCELIEDPELRRRVGQQALLDSRQFRAEAVCQDWMNLFADLSRT